MFCKNCYSFCLYISQSCHHPFLDCHGLASPPLLPLLPPDSSQSSQRTHLTECTKDVFPSQLKSSPHLEPASYKTLKVWLLPATLNSFCFCSHSDHIDSELTPAGSIPAEKSPLQRPSLTTLFKNSDPTSSVFFDMALCSLASKPSLPFVILHN